MICAIENDDRAEKCQSCGAPVCVPFDPHVLTPGTLLQGGTFQLGPCAGHGGFGITYVGVDVRLGRPVAIKEFFPVGCARHGLDVRPSGGWQAATYREGRKRFLMEGASLARFDHPGIVRVHLAFEENDTAYIVMEYLHGQNLEQVLRDRGGRLDEAEALRHVTQVGEALEVVHEARLLHHDVKPANIMVVKPATGQPRTVLVDFGAAREYVAGVSQNQSVMLTPGYAPLELYSLRGRRGRFTDVYSLAAVLYHLLVGEPPPGATDRALGDEVPDLQVECPALSPHIADAVTRGLEMDSKRRPQSVREFLHLLRTPSEAPSPEEAMGAEVVDEAPPSGSVILASTLGMTPATASRPAERPPRDARSSRDARATTAPPPPPALELRPLGMNPQGYMEFESLRDGSTLILVPGLEATVGNDDAGADEMPSHPVLLHPYLLGKYEVTNAQFRQFATETGYDAMANWEKFADAWGDHAPVVCVSWYDALAYCRWAGVRLPTEAEWEFAARGPDGFTWPWGDDWNPACLVWDKNSSSRAHAVGSRPGGISPVGALDMAGNVWEWCSSKYRPYPYQPEDRREDPRGAEDRVVRGGSWSIAVPGSFRSSYRYWACPVNHSNGWGFRVARTGEPPAPPERLPDPGGIKA